MPCSFPFVEGEENFSSRTNDTRDLPEGSWDDRSRQVQDRVEANDSSKGRAGHVKRPQVASSERDRRMPRLSDLNHARRDVDPEDVDAALVEVPGDHSRPASNVANLAPTPNCIGIPIEDLAFDGFAVERGDPMRYVPLSYVVVALNESLNPGHDPNLVCR